MAEEEKQESARRDAILDAALEVFSEVGYERATIKAIAARAGMKSPALLYWYFPSKADIMRGVMSQFMPLVAPSVDHTLLASLPIEVVLRQVASGLIGAYQNNPRLAMSMRLIFGEVMRNADISADVLMAGPTVLLGILRECLRANIARGELRSHDVEVSARMFIGSLIMYSFGTLIVPTIGEGLPSSEAYIDAVVSNLLDGLRVPPESNLQG